MISFRSGSVEKSTVLNFQQISPPVKGGVQTLPIADVPGSVQGLEVRNDAFAMRLEERGESDMLPESGNVLVDAESRSISRDLEQHMARLAKVETSEIKAIDLAAVGNSE